MRARLESIAWMSLLAAGCAADLASPPEAPAEPQVAHSAQELRARRRDEVAAWVRRNHERAGHRIVASEQLASGSLVDWVERGSVAGADVTPPPLPGDLAPPPGVRPAELEALHGPPGALPFIRPSFEPYVDGRSSARNVDEYERALPSGNPSAGAKARLYSGAWVSGTTYGLGGAVNLWAPPDKPAGSDFAITELDTYCLASGVKPFELVGAAAGYVPAVYGTNNYVFAAEYIRGGNNHWLSGAMNQGAWVQVSTTIAPGQNIPTLSVQNGDQWELVLKVVLFNNVGPTPEWWIFVRDQWIGYVDASLAGFTTLNTRSCTEQWFTEVYDPDHMTTHWTNADAGSGLLPNSTDWNAMFRTRQYIRQPVWAASINGGGATYLTLAAAQATFPLDPKCYDVSFSTNGGGAASPSLFVGGPGGNGAGCN